MFCIPEFGQEVTNTLWDPAIVTILNHSNVIQPGSVTIALDRNFTGSSCSLFGNEAISTEDTSEHTSPATIGRLHPLYSFVEDMMIVEGGGFDSTFQITPTWLSTILHICKIHASFAERVW